MHDNEAISGKNANRFRLTHTFIKKTQDGFLLSLRIEPRSSKSAIVGIHGDKLKIKIKSPPVDGKANKELISFLADTFKVRKSDISILSGHNAKEKTVKIVAKHIDSAILNTLPPRIQLNHKRIQYLG